MKIANVQLPDYPIMLAPMEDVSDPPFRAICKTLGADMVFTEFISSEGLIRSAKKSMHKLDIFADERPVGIQIFGDDIVSMTEAAKVVETVQPDVLDINYGCPVSKVVCKGAGAAILKDPDKMERLTREIVRATTLPVTVKTRLGWDQNSIRIIEVALRLQDAGIKALTIHARTRHQMHQGEADWEWVERVKMHPDIVIPIIGNGGINSPIKAEYTRNNYKTDGMMIGSAAIGFPWIFRDIKHYFATGELLPPPSMQERVRVCKTHLEKSILWKGEQTGIVEMRRHYTNYFRGIPDFKPWRLRLVTSDNPADVFELLEQIEAHFSTAIPSSVVPIPAFYD